MMMTLDTRHETRIEGRTGAGAGAVLICGCSVSASTGRQGVGISSIVCVMGTGESARVLIVSVVCDGGVGVCLCRVLRWPVVLFHIRLDAEAWVARAARCS